MTTTYCSTCSSISALNAATMAVAYTTVCNKIEAIIGEDIGKRGIGRLHVPGDLAAAGVDLALSTSVVVLTGFPCRRSETPPTETDGPNGAVAIAYASHRLGKKTALATDDNSAGVLDATTAAVQLRSPPSAGVTSAAPLLAAVELFAFPPPPAWSDDVHGTNLAKIASEYEHSVAIERSGRASDGGYYTMRGYTMNHLVAPIDELLLLGTSAGSSVAAAEDADPCKTAVSKRFLEILKQQQILRSSTGIGDGGNECGMGKVHGNVQAHINNGQQIACAVPADNLVTAGVSNWGGWGLVAAAEAAVRCAIAAEKDASSACAPEWGPKLLSVIPVHILESLRQGPLASPGCLLPSDVEERAMVQAMNDAGAGDGITGAKDGSVDGMPLEVHLGVLQKLRAVLRDDFSK